MGQVEHLVQQALELPLAREGFDRVEIVAIPEGTQRLTQLRTLEDLLESFDAGKTFLLHVRQAKPEGDHFDPEEIEKNGLLLLRAADFDLARVTFLALLRSGERSRAAQLGLAASYEGLQKYEDARRHYEEALAFGPCSRAYLGLIRTLGALKQDAYRADMMDRALEWGGLDPKESKHLALEYVTLSQYYQKIGRPDQARAALDQATRLDPNRPGIVRELALAAEMRGERKLAHTLFCQAFESDPDDAVALEHLLKLSFELREFQPAEKLLANYIDSHPINPSLLYCLAGIRFHLKQDAEALSILRRILSIRPNDSRAVKLMDQISQRRTHGRVRNAEPT